MIAKRITEPGPVDYSSAKHLTVGVAGHVDHGKTALVRALTGMETDRLAEERERGMSIVLGFAYQEFPTGTVDFVDVPGHEKFLKTMISGATGIDSIMLVVDCREGVKPQTAEHLEAATLLGVKSGLVVFTKSDLIDPIERAAVRDRIGVHMAATILESAPHLFVSAKSGDGLDELRCALADQLAAATCEAPSPFFYLPIDRAFSVVGHGVVVTGTLRGGRLHHGETADLGRGIGQVVIRRIQIHGQTVEQAAPGERVAVNLRGAGVAEVRRGDILATPDYLQSTQRIDAEVTVPVRSAALRSGSHVMLHVGAGEVPARVFPLRNCEIGPGQTDLAQIRLQREARLPVAERFLLRGIAPVGVLAGGTILDVAPARHSFAACRRADLDRSTALLGVLSRGGVDERLDARLRFAGLGGLSTMQFQRDWRLRPDDVSDAVQRLGCIACGPVLIDNDAYNAACEQAIAVLKSYHAAHRLRLGMPRDELDRNLLPRAAPDVFRRILDDLARGGRIQMSASAVRMSESSLEERLTAIERRIFGEIEQAYLNGGLKPPEHRSVVGRDRRKKSLFELLVDLGMIVVLDSSDSDGVALHSRAVADASERLKQLLAGRALTVSAIDSALGMSRRISVPLLEHFDRAGLTTRRGNERILRSESDLNT